MEYHGLPEGFKHTSDMDHTKIVGNIDAAAPVHRYALNVPFLTWHRGASGADCVYHIEPILTLIISNELQHFHIIWVIAEMQKKYCNFRPAPRAFNFSVGHDSIFWSMKCLLHF